MVSVIPILPRRSSRSHRPKRHFGPTCAIRGDPVDRSGQAIIELLQQAAETANSNCDRAMELAHKLSSQLRSAESASRELESDTNHFHDRAQRAENGWRRIYKEIEEKFFNPQSGRFERKRGWLISYRADSARRIDS